MANIRLKELLEANVDPKLVARSKESGKLVYFKTPQAKDAALKAGSHLDPKDKKGGQPKADAKPNSMFGADYKKDRGAETSKDDTDWMSDLDSIDTSDIKGKADPNADSFTSNDLYGATFKDPQTGKSITVGDAYEREDDSEAYKKAFAYVSKFDPDKEAVMGTQAYDDLQKKEPSPLPKKASQLDYKHSTYLEKSLSAETGLDFYTNTDDNTDAIMFNPKTTNNYPTYTLYFGGNDDYGKPDEFRVSLLSTYGNDPLNIGDGSIDKTFKSGDDAKKFMIAVAKKYKKELQMDDEDTNESSKLTSMFKK
jgi:hypothetical protein